MTERAPETSRVPVPAVGLTEFLCWIIGLRKRTRINGNSMAPTLRHGDTVLIQRISEAVPGDIVVCRHPFQTNTRIIKRVANTSIEGLFLRGDNPPESTDSESLGRVPWKHLQGRVTARFSPTAANS